MRRPGIWKIIALLFPLYSGAQPVIVPTPGQLTSIGKYVELFEDTSAARSFEQVSDPSFSARFKPSEYEVPNYNVTASALWVRFRIRLPDAHPYYLQVDPPSLREVNFFSRDSSGRFVSRQTGVFYPVSDREVVTNHFMFRLQGRAGDTLVCFLRLANYEPLQADLKVGTPEQFIVNTRHDDAVNIFCFGLIWMMLLYNLYLFITNRDRAYLYYVIYVFFNFYFISFVTGYIVYLPRFLQNITAHWAALAPSLMAVFGMLFAMRFLNTRLYTPRMHKVLLVIGSIMGIIMLMALAGMRYIPIIAMEAMGFIFSTAIISTALLVWRAGYKPAGFMLIGYGFYLFSLVIFICMNIHFLPVNVITMSSLQVGTCIEILFFSFALGDKMNTLKSEKERATEEALQASLANEKLVKEQNTVLEVRVKERTIEIERQKSIIEEKNKDILASIHYAKRIQQALMPTDKYLERVMKRLLKRDNGEQ